MKFTIVKMVADGLVLIRTDGESARLWTRRKLRKESKCAATSSVLPKGSMAYGPIGNESYRYCRLAADVVEDVT